MSHYVIHRGSEKSDYGNGTFLSVVVPDITYTAVTNAINALDDVYRSVRAELTLLAEKGTK
ncbi:hypothetical protein SEA_CIAO_52 [Mycobacterium phage Ciao]|nr:hypothetical protein SEA_GREG_54 [Mycobacterium phage Greg]AUX82440.1 hypothetical protein SEA_PIPPIN_54 [Mycobacterium phage Pippin]AVI03860.1 hypothetical protein SEA_FAJEZEEL_54 [Mycobacterium phage Fajezeel]WNN95910.1 hypothetical protein SEA_CIAO_52 [Mycobacterium phage Ciao]